MPLVWLLAAIIGYAVLRPGQSPGKTQRPDSGLGDAAGVTVDIVGGPARINQKLQVKATDGRNQAFWLAFNRASVTDQQRFLTELAWLYGKVANVPDGYGRFAKHKSYQVFINGKATEVTYVPTAVNNHLWSIFFAGLPTSDTWTGLPAQLVPAIDSYTAPFMYVVNYAQKGWPPLGKYIITDALKDIPQGLKFSAGELALSAAKGAAKGASAGGWIGAIIGAAAGAAIDTYMQENPNG